MVHSFIHWEVKRRTVDASVLTSHIHTPMVATTNHWRQCGVQCLAQGHFDMWTGGAGIRTADPRIIGWPALPPERQPHRTLNLPVCLPDLCHGLKSTTHQWRGVPIWQPAEATQLLSSCGMRSILVLAQGGGRRCCAESHLCLEGRRDGESEATGSQMVQERVKVGQLRYPYRILHRASAKCLDVITLCCACLL